MDENELLDELCGRLGSGRLDPGFVLPAIRELSKSAESRRSTAELLEELQSRPGEVFAGLAAHLRARRRAEAGRCHLKKKAGGDLAEFDELLGDLPLDIPLGWRTTWERLRVLGAAAQASADGVEPLAARLIDPVVLIETLAAREDAAALRDLLAALKRTILEAEERHKLEAGEFLSGERSEFPAELGEDAAAELLRQAFASGPPEARRRALELACSWPTSRMAGVIRDMGERDPRARERALLLLALRHNEPGARDWGGCAAWLARVEHDDGRAMAEVRELASRAPGELLLLWMRGRKLLWPAGARQALEDWVSLAPPRGASSGGVMRSPLPGGGGNAYSAVGTEPAPRRVLARPSPQKEQPALEPKPEPPGPSLWDDHLLPLFSDNWTMLTGIAMVVVGSSLLAYYTWDKHWVWRYTVLPLLLAGFTSALARAASWMEARESRLKGAADMLRGASVALLPANFMAVALLAQDPRVTGKAVLLPVYALAYLAFAGRGLSRWCAAVDPALEGLLGRTLLAINALVLLGPLAQLFDPQGRGVWLALGLGFHVGFALLAAAVVRFLGSLTPKMIDEGRVPWFFAVTLTTTYLQVFLWVHSFMRHLPAAHTYSCLVIAAGALVMFTERTPLIRRKDDPVYGRNSFLGYACVLLGLFMGASHPQVRSLSLALAGAVWLAQAVVRTDVLHAWISFTLLALGGGSIALWEGFPGTWVPILVLALALGVEGAGLAAGRLWRELEKVSGGMQAFVLNAATVSAVLVQWHYRTEPLRAAALLVAAAAFMARRAHVEQKLAHLHAALLTLALALPYLGFADMSGRTLHGNTLVFGLGLLSLGWLAVTRVAATPLVVGARSSVLLAYGALATTAIALRVAFEQGRPEDLQPLQAAMTLAGPPLIGAALVSAAYHARSWLPVALASVIGVVLLPELKVEIQGWLPFIEWGSGLVSSAFALALVLACFPLRAAPWLANLDGGDELSPGRPFPLKRTDHTLFTAPLLASAVFLLVKINSWTLARHALAPGAHLKTAAALVLAGAAWTFLAAYFRESSKARSLGILGWLSGATGLVVGYYDLASAPSWPQAAALAGASLAGLHLYYRHVLAPGAPWAEDLLAKPTRGALRVAAVALGALSIAALAFGHGVAELGGLLAVSAALLAWLGLTEGSPVFGALLFFEGAACTAAWAAPGSALLLLRLDAATCATPLIVFLLALLGAQTALEASPDAESRTRNLGEPLFLWAGIAAAAGGTWAAIDGATAGSLSSAQRCLLVVFVLGTARSQACGPLALLGLALGYVELTCGALPEPDWELRRHVLFSPVMLSMFSLGLAAQGELGAYLHERWPRLVEGPYAQGFFRHPALPSFHGAALALAAASALRHAGDPLLRGSLLQLPAPYLAAGAFALIGVRLRKDAVFWGAALLATLGNVLAVRCFLGDSLRAHGLVTNHLICLGAAATLGQAWLGLRLSTDEGARAILNRVGLAAAGFMLALLMSTYFTRPDLEAMTSARFLVSGLLAFAAGRRFQRAARDPEPGEEAYVRVWEGAYHFALTTALWCLALLLPWFRTPYAAFLALGLPVLYFYARAELSGASSPAVARYRDTAAALAFFLLVLYAFRGAFQAVLFPQAELGLEHYHFNAPFMVLLALVMMRLHALGGTRWLAFYSGLAMMAGSYFSLTSLPGLSPFEYQDPAASAWCAVALGHFWMLVSAQPSPARTALQRLGAMEDEHWASCRGAWGLVLLAATQFAVAYAIAHRGDATLLLIGGTSLLAHQSWLRRSKPLYAFALIEWLLAVHSGGLPEGTAVWAVLGTWGALLAVAQSRRESLVAESIGATAPWLAALALWHAARHAGFGTDAGLAVLSATTGLLALTPRVSREGHGDGEAMIARAIIASPSILVLCFSLRYGTTTTLLATTVAMLATGTAARRAFDRTLHEAWTTSRPRAFHNALWLLGTKGAELHSALLAVSTALAFYAQATRYGELLSPGQFTLLSGLYAGCALAWFHEARRRQSMAGHILMQACGFGLLAALRRQAMLAWGHWSYEYDVWASLLVSFSLAGARQLSPSAPREARVPLVGSLCAMPLLALGWVAFRGLGTDMALLVVGLNTLVFAYMGKDDRESPYHVVAMAGLVSFVCLVFWDKLELRVVQAYVLPVGAGILTLVQLLRDKIAPDARNQIRAATLLAMLGSAGYYALADDRYPLAFHTTMLVVSVFSMAAGSLLRVRLYVLLGMCGLGTDLASLVYKVLLHMDRSSRMTLVGTQVLILGALLIGGAVVYKTHQEKFDELIERWRLRLMAWE